MPQPSIILLPLIGGFIFVYMWYRTGHIMRRSDSQRLIFFSSLAGAIFFLVSALIVWILRGSSAYPAIISIWKDIVGHDANHLGKSALAFIIGIFSWMPMNLTGHLLGKINNRLGPVGALNRAINAKKDPMELMMRDSLAYDKDLSVTIRNGKVYIGIVTSLPNPAFQMQTLGLLLSWSGHRNKETQVFEIDVYYKRARERNIKERLKIELEKQPKLNDFQTKAIADKELKNYIITIPMTEIQSINFFDYEDYEKRFWEGEQRPE